MHPLIFLIKMTENTFYLPDRLIYYLGVQLNQEVVDYSQSAFLIIESYPVIKK